jgi:hypothetical protein
MDSALSVVKKKLKNRFTAVQCSKLSCESTFFAEHSAMEYVLV